MPEPEKGLEINAALIKQLTGGDKYTGRFLYENPFEITPEFKIFINTNHLPRTSDDTVFASDRVKLIPFERHFAPKEQDNRLKKLFRQQENMSGILNWLLEGYLMMQKDGLTIPRRVAEEISAYRQEADVFGAFLAEYAVIKEKSYIPTSKLYAKYMVWAKNNGYQPMNNKDFVGVLRLRCVVSRYGAVGNVVAGWALVEDETMPLI
jgi:putative DNA primase/helicase